MNDFIRNQAVNNLWDAKEATIDFHNNILPYIIGTVTVTILNLVFTFLSNYNRKQSNELLLISLYALICHLIMVLYFEYLQNCQYTDDYCYKRITFKDASLFHLSKLRSNFPSYMMLIMEHMIFLSNQLVTISNIVLKIIYVFLH